MRLAYRLFGEGDVPVLVVPGWAGNIGWYDEPLHPMASATQLVAGDLKALILDRRGNGLSDPVSQILSLEERSADLLAIVDDAGFDRFGIFGTGDSGAACLQFTVDHPDRVDRLLLYGSAARYVQSPPDFPWGLSPAQIADIEARIDEEWGEGLTVELMTDAVNVPAIREMYGRMQRSAVGATGARWQLREMAAVDALPLLKSVRVPTMLMSRPGDRMVPFEAAAATAAAIPGAVFQPLPAGPHLYFDILDVVASHVVGFFSGRPPDSPEDRVLKTILFTDIVGSTASLAAQGDAHWRHQLNMHDAIVDGLVTRFDGRRVNHTGDGIFALFDTPTHAVRCAIEMRGALARIGIQIRAGVHIGECERRGEEWSGLAVHVGARIAALAEAGEVLTSRTVRDLCAGSGLLFHDRGPRHLKGIPDDASVYSAERT